MSVQFQRVMMAMVVVLAAAFVAAGCGSDDTGSSSGGTSDDLAKKQELVVNQGTESESGLFNPIKMSSLNAVNSKGYVQFAGLYRIEGNDNEVVPHLAEGEPEISDDGLTYTIKLRDDASWSDGKPIVAEDVVTAVRYALDSETAAPFASFIAAIVGGCESLAGGDKDALAGCAEPRTDGSPEQIGVTATDEHTVEIKLTTQVPWFTQLLTIQIFYPLRADQLKAMGDEYGKDLSTAVSGPFKLESYDPDGDIVFAKNDKYFGADDVTLDKLTFRTVAEATTAAKDFERGRLDTGLQNTMFDAAEVDKWKAEDTFMSGVTVGSQYMYMNTTNPELSDPKVRQALALAINRKDIVENITKKGDIATSTVVPPAIPGFNVWGQGAQDFVPTEEAQVDKARDLLEEGGFDKSKELTMYFASDSGNAQAIAEQIQSNLAEIGVKTSLKPTPSNVFFSDGYAFSPTDKRVDLLLAGWIQDYFDAQDWYQLFYGPNVEGQLNSSNYESADYDKIYDEAVKTVDDDARYELYKQLEAKLTGPEGDMPAAPLYVQADATLVQPYVRGMELIPSGLLYWENVSITEH